MPRKQWLHKGLLTLFLVCATALCPALGAAGQYVGAYVNDGRTFDEYVGFTATLTVTDLGGGSYGFALQWSNPALCGGSLEAQGPIQDNAAVIADPDFPAVVFEGDVVHLDTGREPMEPDHCTLTGDYYREGTYPPATEQEVVARIREYYAYMHDNADSYEFLHMDVPDMSTEGGEMTAWFDMTSEYVKKISAAFYGEMGNISVDYYFWINEPLFCFQATTRYDKPFGQVVSVDEDRYYFHHGAMVRWIGPDGEQVSPEAPEFAARRDEILEQGATLRDMALRELNPR